MKTRKQFGFTTPECWNCDNDATKYNKNKLPCCKNCINIQSNIKCPICKNILNEKSGKFGGYFHCMSCQVNYSIKKIKKIMKK